MNKYARSNIEARATHILFEALPDLLAVYVFGSASTVYERAGSDLDLAILSARPLESVFVWELGERIAACIGRDVDLVDLRRASTVMIAQIVSSGRRLSCADEAHCAAFEAHAFSDYARLNEERRDIVADIRARGLVHG